MPYITESEFKAFLLSFTQIAGGAALETTRFTAANLRGEAYLHTRLSSRFKLPFVLAAMAQWEQDIVTTLSCYATGKILFDMAILRLEGPDGEASLDYNPFEDTLERMLTDLVEGAADLPSVEDATSSQSVQFDVALAALPVSYPERT